MQQFWPLTSDEAFETTGFQVNDLPELRHQDAVMPTKEEATFTSVGCGYGACKLKTFAVTADGTLCCFGENGTMERLVSLETPAGYALSVTEAYIAVGGASSVIRLFDPATLEYRGTLPFAPAFGSANQQPEALDNGDTSLYPEHPHRYPAAIAVRITGSHVVALYNDRSLFIYDVSNVESVQIERSFLFHCGGIREMQIVGRVRGVNSRGKLVYEGDQSASKLDPCSAGETLPIGAFVTCSDDNTARIWHLDLHKKPTAPVSRFDHNANNKSVASEAWSNPFSQEMLAVVYHDNDHDFEDDGNVVLGGCCSHKAAPDIHEPAKDRGQATGLRTIAIRPDRRHFAAGDNDGNIRLIPLPIGTPKLNMGPHSAEVHTIAYAGISSAESSGHISNPSSIKYLMASGSRDRLVQVYDCAKNYAAICTLENHSGAVTGVAFAHDGSKLLTCGADKMMVFSDVNMKGGVSRYNSVPFNGGKIFDFAITSDNKTVIAASNNRLDMLSLNTGKHIKSHHVGEQHHMDISPGNVCVAVSGSISDKTIHIVDLESGETLANATGHGEAITSVRFTPDCRRLLSTSNDGCIFVWRLSDNIQAAIKASLPRVVEQPVPLPSPPKKAVSAAPPPLPVLMPPPPPLPVPKQIAPKVAAEAKTPPKSQPERSAKKKAAAADKSKMIPSADTSAHAGISESKMGWKGKASAAPGPMSGVPMEEWMRTRESAKPIIAVTDSTSKPRTPPRSEQCSPGKCAVISIDRSKTPDWAKTAAPTRRQSGSKSSEGSPVHGSRIPVPQLPRGKWGEHVGDRKTSPNKERQHSTSKDVTLGSSIPSCSPRRQSGSRLHISKSEDEADVTSPGIRNAETSKLMGLSVDDLDISPKSSLRESTTLALEREQLEKRQKQIDTANAVAAMNLKLSQLGLLKPKNTGERRASGSAMPRNTHEAPSPAPSPTKSEPAKDREQGNFVSIDTFQATNVQSTEDNESIGYDSSSSSSDSDSSQGTEEALEREELANKDKSVPTIETKEEDTEILRPDIPLEMLESIDIPLAAQSIHVSSPVIEKSSIDESTRLRQDMMDQSLSTFTQGFSVDSHALVTNVNLQDLTQNKPAIPVDCSLSAFSAGYVRDSREHAPKSVPVVTASLSMFTSGYQSEASESNERGNTDNKEVPDAPCAVDCSISAFTTGYTSSASQPPSEQTLPNPEAMQSISVFTSGYSAVPNAEVARQSIAIPSVAASLSTFTSGYVAGEESHHISTQDKPVTPLPEVNCGEETGKSAELRESSMDSALGDDDEPSHPSTKSSTRHPEVMQSLSSFTSGYEFVSLPLSHSVASSDEEEPGSLMRPCRDLVCF